MSFPGSLSLQWLLLPSSSIQSPDPPATSGAPVRSATIPYMTHCHSPILYLAISLNRSFELAFAIAQGASATMHNTRTHPLLAQVPLTVSPFVTLPVAATLPYTYKNMPSTLPPSSTTGITNASSSSSSADAKPKYVISSSGHAAHPDDIVASCRALQAHVTQMQEEAGRELRALEERIAARELAEKRRVAPGWLDSEARLLEPEKKMSMSEAGDGLVTPPLHPYPQHGAGGGDGTPLAGQFAEMSLADRQGASEMAVDQGEELDRAFGGMK
ncbi:hypothetical protein PG990_001981 [Apiospora arundinis]|uniref:Uncharacterized protein n=1 Tax=Apiospora arundinis TaxID=335852 RepID=A0ABR2I3E6_9PEZI